MARSAATEPQADVSERARRELWFRGDLSYLLRPHGQLWCYQHYHRRIIERPNDLNRLVLNCHRRMGKTFFLLILAIERALRYPGQQVKFVAPTKEEAKGIVEPILRTILDHCPKQLRPRTRGGRQEYIFHNPRWERDEVSELKLYGVNNQHEDDARGLACDLGLFDEAGYFDNLPYVLESVFLYQFARRQMPAMILSSSMPESMAHSFVEKYIPVSQESGDYLEVPGSKNPDYTEADKRLILQIIDGGESSVNYRREVECLRVSDESQMILPEFQTAMAEIVVPEYERPRHFQPWVCLDTGWVDFTAILFAYVDWEEQLLVIEDVIFQHYKSTGQIARYIEETEERLWPREMLAKMEKKVRRVGDCTEQQLNDFRKDHKVPIKNVENYDPGGAIARLRSAIQKRKVRIIRKPSTEPLIYQCLHGIWKETNDGKRKDFARVSSVGATSMLMGHCDCIAALMYLWRSVKMRENPNPETVYSKGNKFWIDFRKIAAEEKSLNDLKKAFSSHA